jgi:Protein of unknown function (DUF2785)
MRASLLAAAALFMVHDGSRALQEPTVHERAFWVVLREDGFKVPKGESAARLALEAAALLGSTDPELRDAIAYEAIETWVYREQRLDATELERLRLTLISNARRGLGAGISDELFGRSFSTLALAVLAAEDLKKPFLDAQRFDELLALGSDALANERDLRGYVPGKGWGHATAHCADLLKFLARSHWLRPEQQRLIVDAIAGRLRSAGQVFVWGEDERLAAALAALASRSDADPALFSVWFKQLSAEHTALWSGQFDPARYVPVRAQLNAVSALAADLDGAAGPGATISKLVRALRAATQ